MTYANRTKVSTGKSLDEIKKKLTASGANSFMSGEMDGVIIVAFTIDGMAVKMQVPMPPSYSSDATAATMKSYDQICRTKWRCLLLVIKAKIEAIESGIETFEQAFFPYFLAPNGRTLEENLLPALKGGTLNNKLLLGQF